MRILQIAAVLASVIGLVLLVWAPTPISRPLALFVTIVFVTATAVFYFRSRSNKKPNREISNEQGNLPTYDRWELADRIYTVLSKDEALSRGKIARRLHANSSRSENRDAILNALIKLQEQGRALSENDKWRRA